MHFLGDEIDETYGVNVEFDESDNEDQGGEDEVRDDDEDLSEGEEAKTDYTIQETNYNKTVCNNTEILFLLSFVY